MISIDLSKKSVDERSEKLTTINSNRQDQSKDRRGSRLVLLAHAFESGLSAIVKDAKLSKLSAFNLFFGTVSLCVFAYALWADSLALLADSMHMMFQCSTLLIRLSTLILTEIVSASNANVSGFSYGTRRIEVVLTFCSAASAVFVAMYLLFESVEHYIVRSTPLHNTNNGLVTVAALGMLAKMTGALFFNENLRVRNEWTLAANGPDRWPHLTVDCVCSLGVILNGWLVSKYNTFVADAVIAFLLAALLIGAALPICSQAALVLLHATPLAHRDALAAATRDALLLNGVVDCKAPHFWTVAPGVVAGSIVVVVRRDADRAQLQHRMHHIFAPLVTDLTVQLECDAASLSEHLHDDREHEDHEHDESCSSHAHAHAHAHGAHAEHDDDHEH
jgi:cobalt-zinc-cadmium efflux system protein